MIGTYDDDDNGWRDVLLVIDEALQSEGFSSGQTVLSADVRAVRSFASILRKLRISVVLIAQSWRMVQSSYRNADFITGLLRRRWDGQLVPGYNRREVLQVIGPRGYEIRSDRLIVHEQYTFMLATEPKGFGMTSELAEPGDVVCDPCCGAGTALIAALRSGRTAIGGDSLREHAEMAARRLDELVQRPLFV